MALYPVSAEGETCHALQGVGLCFPHCIVMHQHTHGRVMQSEACCFC